MLDELRNDLGDILRRRRLRCVDAVPAADEPRVINVDQRSLDAGTANVNTEKLRACRVVHTPRRPVARKQELYRVCRHLVSN
jgi:hypothetical protein